MTKEKLIENAKKVILSEANALQKLSSSLENSQNFIDCVDLLLNIQGKICLTGIGKSAHIAKKIAATLSSTGSPAYFIHPSEASHGDLGAISKSDAVVMLSNSGQSQELHDIIIYTVRHNIPLIAITTNPNSFLANNAKINMILPKLPEACPLGLAPTNSSTMMLALGDALAICLLEEKNFSFADFGNFHPGGKLGKQFIKVKDIMHTKNDLPLVYANTPMSEAIITMSSKNFGCLGVLDSQDKLIGIVSDGDLRRNMQNNLLAKNADDIMTKNPLCINENELVVKAINIMNDRKITCLFITKNSEPIGLVHLHDCLKI